MVRCGVQTKTFADESELCSRRSVEVIMWKLFAPKNRLEPATQGATKLQPAVRVGPYALLTKTLSFRYQIAVLRVVALKSA